MSKYVRIDLEPAMDAQSVYFKISDEDLEYAIENTNDFADVLLSDRYEGMDVVEAEEVAEDTYLKADKYQKVDWER